MSFALAVIAKGEALKQSPPVTCYLTAHSSSLADHRSSFLAPHSHA
ncbi:hypothetical protein [Fibrobacter sp.]|nr:hypothetical protein [Fibrobacter sp.]MBO7060766.1 hypothetical protein [Fibrobacter sp.]MBO7105620.1 hypothetical protein [Fibrobacter sp.]